MKQSIKLIITLIFMLLLLSFWGFYNAVRPYRMLSTATPAQFGLAYEKISFRTQDNVEIKGWFVPSSQPHAKTIILLHGYPADKGNILPTRIFLHDNYHLLFLDFRYHGESGGHYTTLGKDEVLDLLAAIRYLKTKNINDVGVWGLSMGGAVALMAARETTAIKAIVAEASYAQLDWMLDHYYGIPVLNYPLAWFTHFWAREILGIEVDTVSPMVAVANLTVPILLIHSRNDQVVPFTHAKALQQALKENPRLTTRFVNDASHGQISDQEQKVIKEFFQKNLH